MQVDYMREYLTVADVKSISLAAKELHITQPVLSKHIRSIEESLHSQLFFRSPKGMTVTPHGEIAYKTFKEIVSEYDELQQFLKMSESELCGKITFGILSSGFDAYIGPIVQNFRKLHPNVSFVFETRSAGQLITGVIDGKYDVAFIGSLTDKDNYYLRFTPIGEERFHFLVNKNGRLGNLDVVTPDDMADMPLICLSTKSTTNAINEALFSAGYHPPKLIYIDEVELAPFEILSTDGYFAIPNFMIDKFRNSKDLHMVETSEPIGSPVALISLKLTNSPLVHLFLEWVKDYVSENQALPDDSSDSEEL